MVPDSAERQPSARNNRRDTNQEITLGMVAPATSRPGPARTMERSGNSHGTGNIASDPRTRRRSVVPTQAPRRQRAQWAGGNVSGNGNGVPRRPPAAAPTQAQQHRAPNQAPRPTQQQSYMTSPLRHRQRTTTIWTPPLHIRPSPPTTLTTGGLPHPVGPMTLSSEATEFVPPAHQMVGTRCTGCTRYICSCSFNKYKSRNIERRRQNRVKNSMLWTEYVETEPPIELEQLVMNDTEQRLKPEQVQTLMKGAVNRS